MPRRTSFWERLTIADGCWLFSGPTTHNGYGRVNIGGHRRAHRYAWSELRGAIPDGLHLDHLCRNRLCVNPDHLEVVTQAVNNARAQGFSDGIQTHCKRGHEFTEENTHLRRGRRNCRACQRIYNAARKA